MLTASTLFIFVLGCFTVLAHPSSNTRVVGGTDAPDGAYPYQVLLTDRASICGGSIISNQWILTAAHCVYGKPAASFVVIVGTNYADHGGTGYGVELAISHPQYSPNPLVNDIALVRIFGFISYSNKVQPIRLANIMAPSGTVCILTGWGRTQYPGNYPINLQQVLLSIISLPACQNAHSGFPILPSNVCTFQGNGYGSCFGDSGGPLVCNGEQQGIVSWGNPCAVGSPDVFASVPYFRDWIAEVTGV